MPKDFLDQEAQAYKAQPVIQTGYTSIENTCEKDPLWDSMSNAFSVKFSGDPRNPRI